MATPTFTGEEYLSAISEFPGGPQGLIDAAVERFGAQGLTATPRGNDFSLFVPGEFMSSGRPMNYASRLVDPTVGGGYYDYLYSTPAFKDIYTNILSPTITGFQPQVIAPEQPVLEPTLQIKATEQRPITKTSPEFKLRSDDNDEIEDDFTIEDIATGGNVVANEQVDPPTLQENISTPPASTKTIQTEVAQPQIAKQKQPTVEQNVGDVLDNLDFENDPDATAKLINSFAGTEVIDIKTGREQVSKTAPAPTPSYTRANYQPYIYEDNLRDLFNKNTMASRLGSFSPPADAYLKGGRDYISYDGPGGFADIMSKSMTDPRFVSGESVGLPTVTYRSKGDIVQAPDYLQLDPKMNVGDVAIPYAGQSRGQDEKIKRILADVPDGVFWEKPDTWKFSDENLPNGLKAAIQDLVSARATEDGDTVFVEAREGIEGTEDPFDYVRDDVSVLEQWLGIRFTDNEKQAMYGSGEAEDFRFYEHPGVRKKFSDGLDTLKEAADLVRKGLFGQTPYGPEEENKQPLNRVTARVRSLGNTLAELNSEVSTLIELEGDSRKSIGTYDPKFPTLKGLLQLATGTGLSDIDKQKYGSLNVGALATLATIAATAPQATAAVLGLQITNTLRKITPQILNVATFKEADYSGGLFSDVVEFSGEVMRPIGRFFVENIFQKINENAPDDANLRSQFESLFEGDKPQNFAEYLEPEATVVVNRPDFPSVDPTGQITPPGTGMPFSEAPASQGNPASGSVISRPGTETPILPGDGLEVNVDYTSPFEGQGVSAGPAPVAGSSLPGVTSSVVEPTLVNPKTITIGPAAESPFAGMGVSAGISPGVTRDLPLTNPSIADGVIPTLDTEFQFVPDISTMPSPFTGMSVSAGELPVRPRVDLENVPYSVEPTQVDSDGIPFAENIQIDVPRVPRYGATEGTTPFTEVSPRPSLDPVIREPAGNLVETTVPLDKNGNIVLDGDVSKVAGFGKGTVNLDDIREVFGERAATAIAAGEEGSQYGNPFGKLREQWDVQQADKLASELAKEVRSNLTDILGEGKTKATYDRWVGTDLRRLGGGYFDNVTNASPIDTALAILAIEPGEVNGTTQAERLQSFANKMNLSISNLAFSGVKLDDIGNLDPARLSFPASTWEMLNSNPSQSSIVSLGEIRPEAAINKLQNIQTQITESLDTGSPNLDILNDPNFALNPLNNIIIDQLRAEGYDIPDKQTFPEPERLSDEFGNPIDTKTSLPFWMLDWGGGGGVSLDLSQYRDGFGNPIITVPPGP